MAKISVIITCYNVEEYVSTAIQSVIDCGFDDLELIVVDDGSTDKTRHLVDLILRDAPSGITFEPIYSTVNTIGGVACAANIGLEKATGDIVVFVDGDDWVIPHNLREAVSLLEHSHADFVVCDCREYGNNNGKYSQYPEHYQWHLLHGIRAREEQRKILLRMAPFPWRKVYRREFLESNNIRFPIGPFFFEDNPFHWETTIRAEKFVFLEKVTHVHRMDRAGQTVASKGAKYLKIFDHADIIRKMLEDRGEMQTYRIPYINWLLRHILWCSKWTLNELQNQVYKLSVEHLRRLNEEEFNKGIQTERFKMSDVRLLTTLFQDEKFEYLREIRDSDESTAKSRSKIENGYSKEVSAPRKLDQIFCYKPHTSAN